MTIQLDHLAVSAETLPEGVEYVEDLLGVKTEKGGKHPLMGTHNHLLSLGSSVYLEVIAIDPDAPDPGRARWFDLDRFSGTPRLTNWICRTDDLTAAAEQAPAGIGRELALMRGDLKWRMLVPENGRLPFDGAYPALISWDGTAHPARVLPDSGCRLTGLQISHPDGSQLCRVLPPLGGDTPLAVKTADQLEITAEIQTPRGGVTLK